MKRLSVWQRRALYAFAGLVAIITIAIARPYPRAQLTPHASLVFTDRHGELLHRTAAADGGKQVWVPIDKLPPLLVTVLLESEDRDFFDHHGVSATALVRSVGLNLRRGSMAFGGSTLTMQAVRLIVPHPRTLLGKGLEIVDALRLERAIDKQQILEQYLNRAYFGRGAVGVESASWRYFGHSATRLSLAEATLLAVLVRGPRVYDLVNHLDRAVQRRDALLARIATRSLITDDERRRITAEVPRILDSDARAADVRLAPHFIDWVQSQLAADVIERGGIITTTLDLPLQRQCERLVRAHVDELASDGVGQAGVVVIDAANGEVRCMVGSRDYDDPNGGMINITTTPRSPGSSLKPFTYALALERGDTPATLAPDVRDDVVDAPEGRHARNADGREHGPVRYRNALASSYNLSALAVTRRIGADALLHRLRQAGLTTLTKNAEQYGDALTLGSGRVRLVDLTAGYRFLVAGGSVIAAHGVAALQPAAGKIERRSMPAESVYSATASYLTMDMLADPSARRAAFGDDLPVDNLTFRVVAKTGTSGGFADNVAVLATREYLVGAWAGNFDGQGLHGLLAMWGAAPLARRALLAAANGRALTLPPRPDDVHRHAICALSGKVPGAHCPIAHELFADDNAPRTPCDWHRADGSGVDWPVQFAAWAERVRHAGRPNVD